jgi:uncharacterized membrane protein
MPLICLCLIFLLTGGAAFADTTSGLHSANYPPFEEAAHWIATGFEIVGISMILVVAVFASARFLREASHAPDWFVVLSSYRTNIGRGVLIGLELLVAADIVGMVAVAPSFGSLGVLAIVIFIRTFLSVSLSVEIDGHWPWRRQELTNRKTSA